MHCGNFSVRPYCRHSAEGFKPSAAFIFYPYPPIAEGVYIAYARQNIC